MFVCTYYVCAVTVFDGNVYVGEAVLDTLMPNEQTIIPYSLEMACGVKARSPSTTFTPYKVNVSGGTILFTQHQRTVHTYNIKNNTARTVELILEHPVAGGAQIESAKVFVKYVTSTRKYAHIHFLQWR